VSLDLWGYGWRTAADYDPSYFPGWHPDDEVVEHPDDPIRDDLGKAWIIGDGLDKRRKHIQNGADFGPAQPHENLNTTEQWLRNIGHEFATRIHRAAPFDGELLRAMVVHPEWITNASRSRSVTLPLSSADEDPTIASCYTVPHRDQSPGSGVFMAISPGAKAYPFGDDRHDTEYLTHGDFDVHEMYPATSREQEQYGIDPGTMFMRLRQRHVPAPAGTHTAARLAMPSAKIYRGLEIEPGQDVWDSIHGSEKNPGGVGPHWSTSRSVAEGFAGPYGVVLEADHPGEEWVSRDNFYNDPQEYAYEHEVPLEHNAPINITSVTHQATGQELLKNPRQTMANQKEAHLMTAAVTVYTKPNCVQCDMTHKLLTRMNIEHNTVDVTQDPDAHAYVSGLGYSSAPVVVVNDGEAHWSGFRPEQLRGLVE